MHFLPTFIERLSTNIFSDLASIRSMDIIFYRIGWATQAKFRISKGSSWSSIWEYDLRMLLDYSELSHSPSSSFLPGSDSGWYPLRSMVCSLTFFSLSFWILVLRLRTICVARSLRWIEKFTDPIFWTGGWRRSSQWFYFCFCGSRKGGVGEWSWRFSSG